MWKMSDREEYKNQRTSPRGPETERQMPQNKTNKSPKKQKKEDGEKIISIIHTFETKLNDKSFQMKRAQ